MTAHRRGRRSRLIGSAAAAAVLVLTAACGDATSVESNQSVTSLADEARRTATSLGNEARQTATSLGNAAGSAADDAGKAADKGVARVQAEAFRLQAKNLSSNDASRWTTITVLQQAAKDLVGNPTVSGISDGNGDGKDDDGKVEIAVDGAKACVTLATSDISVSSNPC